MSLRMIENQLQSIDAQLEDIQQTKQKIQLILRSLATSKKE